MTDITRLPPKELPSAGSLIKATGMAAVIAGILLLTMVLPAEYGIDPTGIGTRLGVTSLSVASVPTEPVTNSALQSPVWRQVSPYRTDTLSIQLQPGEGKEIKAKMKTDERFIFSWTADGGAVNFDMHGEPLNAKADEFISYWKGLNQPAAHGAFVAPMDGTHGWYWRNRTENVVTVTVTISGYYEKLYQP